jgi:hypothetical protein
MSKKASDFYGDLQKLAQDEAGKTKSAKKFDNQEYVKLMTSKPFPWGKILFLLCAIGFGLKSYFAEISQTKFYQENVRPLPVVQKVYQTMEIKDPPPASSAGAVSGNSNGVVISDKNLNGDEGSATSASVQAAREKAKEAAEDKNRMVQIGGKYYKYNPTNIYMINGEKIFHIEPKKKSPVIQK